MPEGHSLVLAARRIEPVVGQRVTAGPLAGTSRVEVVRSVRLRLGPDLLGSSFDAAAYLGRARRLDRPVAELLLDERVMAGVGNIVRAEVLCPACQCAKRGQTPFGAQAS